ncbi:MAG TPA: bifunctional precorrin-2 dehydrogenase/sirohydrochlorin ferrochelatase [Chitinophagales bacterium]
MATELEINTLFPVFLKLEKLNVLLVGAGNVGVEKAKAILKNSPQTKLSVVAAFVSDEMKMLPKEFPQISIVAKAFDAQDLDSVQILFLAINDKAKSADIVELAHSKNILVNVADTPDLCDFYLSSVVQKGNLKIAISTNGKSPTLAKRLRELLEESLPDSIEILLQNLYSIRENLKGDFAEKVRQLNELTDILKNKMQK